MKYIVIPANEKNQFVLEGAENEKFIPVELKSGEWVLPETVLLSPNFPKGKLASLEAKPLSATVARTDFAKPIEKVKK